jgi:amino acid transporter
MERFVRLVVAGGLATVAGLWGIALTSRASPPWLVGILLATLGLLAMGAGTYEELGG